MDRPPIPLSLPGSASRVFAGTVGNTHSPESILTSDLVRDSNAYASEGDWAFCTFDNENVPALRVGYQLGTFNIHADKQPHDPEFLQLHLEVVTAEGAMLWLPRGVYSGSALTSDPSRKSARLIVDHECLLSIDGWPQMEWLARTADGEMEIALEVKARSVTFLPDCLLPHAVFGMWEATGDVRGSVRIGSSRHQVQGRVFYDHPRVIHVDNARAPRAWYLYTTLALEDGSEIFGYQAVDTRGVPMPDYCFGVFVDQSGNGTFLNEAEVRDLEIGADGLPTRWQFEWMSDEVRFSGSIDVRDLPLLRAWGTPSAPRERGDMRIFPLVLDGTIRKSRDRGEVELRGQGMAEYWEAETRPR